LELALRLALGASPERLLAATLGQTSLIVVAGLAVGGLLSIWTSRALGSLVVTAGGFDALSVALPAAVVGAAGIAAVLPAARQAARTDPSIALRGE
jgi:putative ABC transport system permease protein